jgi:DNA-binding GntR family transcriptional regulator
LVAVLLITPFDTFRITGVTVAEPMYRVIAADLRRQIEHGELPAGSQLATEVELREMYGRPDAPISRTTIRDAIKLLLVRQPPLAA